MVFRISNDEKQLLFLHDRFVYSFDLFPDKNSIRATKRAACILTDDTSSSVGKSCAFERDEEKPDATPFLLLKPLSPSPDVDDPDRGYRHDLLVLRYEKRAPSVVRRFSRVSLFFFFFFL